MGCDIHLMLEYRHRKMNDKPSEWKSCLITKNNDLRGWSVHNYHMYALLANVRNYNDDISLPIRGIPSDATYDTMSRYCLQIIDDEQYKYVERTCRKSQAEEWIRQGISHRYDLGDYNEYISNPDWHTPNWCTTQEMEDCINKSFKKYNLYDYTEWFALLGSMKGYEMNGEFECRAVFWFDN